MEAIASPSLKCGESLKAQPPLMQAAFVDFAMFAMRQDQFTAAFTKDTGISCPRQPTSPLDAMIDKATGAHEGWAAAFIDWLWYSHWNGPDDPDD